MRCNPITWETFLGLDQDVQRDLEIVDGVPVPREERTREHQKVGARLAQALEQAAAHPTENYETDTQVDVLLWQAPPTARKPDVVLHHHIPASTHLAAEHAVVVAEVQSTSSRRRDRVHKMSDYADAGIPHYWLVTFDKIGALSIERYASPLGSHRYTQIGTTHRDMGPVAVTVTDPFPMEILWEHLEVAPRV
ncbi:Uma2 family endonuclease [Actinomadura meridiana]|uniref:Uma2 family endonuclease n=1 Tax=Actinomadura meridiana TaxID=559626 RepID=UPI0031E8036A